VGLIGSGVADKDGYKAGAVVVGNLVWVPAHQGGAEQERAVVKRIVGSLLAEPYVSGLFVDGERFGEVAGTLPLSAIGLKGSARTPVPAVVINFRSFSTDPARPEMTGVEFAETTLRQGQGMHGSFGRHTTYNCMMAFGPDFKAGFVDGDPVSNADIAMTMGKVVGINLMGMARGQLHGRVIGEALAGGPGAKGAERKRAESKPGEHGEVTTLLYQVYRDEAGREYLYFDAGGFVGRTVGLEK
jgi:hypothetical protein